MASIINSTDTGSGGLITTGDSSDELQLQTAETARVTLTNTAVVVNEDGNDVDFRVEGDTDANLLFVDASADAVGIGTSSPTAKAEISSASTSTVLRITTTAGSGNRYSQLQFMDGATQSCQIYQNHNGGALAIRNNTASGSIVLFTNDTTNALTYDASGNLQFNSGYGTDAIAYGCRAWVNFNGTGTVAIRASGNVSSITDNGTGLYTINFSSAMPDGNYAPAGLARDGSNANGQINFRYNVAPATGSLAVETVFVSLFNDADYASIIVIR